MEAIDIFKAKYLVLLLKVSGELHEKYPDKSDRISYFVDILEDQLNNLSKHTLIDYLHSPRLAIKEFREFEKLIPSQIELLMLMS